MKIAYIGIDIMFSVLEILSQNGCEIAEIFTCKTDNFTEFNTKITAFAEKNGIPYTDMPITVSDFDRLLQKGCEAVICAGYYHRIPVYEKIPTVNVHPSYLPYGRGSWPMPYYILENRRLGGISVHKVAEGYDTGDILFQRRFRLTSKDNLETYMEKAIEAISDDLKCLSDRFKKMFSFAEPQKGKGVYLKAPSKDMFTVNSQTDIKTADRIFRAFYGYECFYTDGVHEYMLIKPKAVNRTKCSDCDKYIAFKLSDGFAVCEKELVKKVK